MNEFIICLIKYTAIFTCILYAYTKLLRIKLKVWDLFDIPLFATLSAGLYIVRIYIKMLVPAGFLIIGTVFLFLRFRKTFYETVTVGTIALGISITIMLPSFLIGLMIAPTLYLIKNENFKLFLAQLIVSIFQLIGIFLLFKIKRLRSGIYPKSKNATFDILLYISIICIFTMMLLYGEEVTQYMLKVVLLVIALCGLLLILWWRRHITYTYREAVKQQNANRLENSFEEYKRNAAEKDLQLAVYSKLFHYLNKAVPDCVLLAESTAAQTDFADACAARDMLQHVLREMNLANEKCSFINIPQTGVREIDVSIVQLFTVAEHKNLDVSADISADVERWFTESKLHKDDVHILFRYLCDNAIISALGLKNAKVRVELGATTKLDPLIRIYDSGEQFDEKVLSKLGLEQITTRAGVGGNGIGLFTVFQILTKYGASFTLNEAPEKDGFTKLIEIAFDGRHSVTVRTCRAGVIAVCTARKDMTVERIESLDDGALHTGTNG